MASSYSAAQNHTAGLNYSKTSQRIHHAELSYRDSPDQDWAHVDHAYPLPEDESRGKLLPCNVCDVEIDGTKCTLGQQELPYNPHSQPMGKRASDRIRVETVFTISSFQDFLLDEEIHQNAGEPFSVISITFTSDWNPVPQVKSRSYVQDTGTTLPVNPFAALDALSVRANNLPLAEFARSLTSGQPRQLRLRFIRNNGKRMISRQWNWPASLHFLSGHAEYRTVRCMFILS